MLVLRPVRRVLPGVQSGVAQYDFDPICYQERVPQQKPQLLTVLSIAFSLVLLTFMMSIWRAFELDEGSAESAQRLVVRHRVSLTFNLPGFYRKRFAPFREWSVVPVSWFGGVYKDQKPDNFFARFLYRSRGTLETFRDIEMPEDQRTAWERDRQGVIVDDTLAKKYGWKLGDRIVLKGTFIPLILSLTFEEFSSPIPTTSLFISMPSTWRKPLIFSRGGRARSAFWRRLPEM